MSSFVRSGAAFAANSLTASSQTRSSITALSDGGFVAVWQTAAGGIKAQRFDAQGIAAGAETLVNQGTAGSMVWPRVTSLASGGYVVTWETTDQTRDTYGTAIMGRMFDAAGAPVGNEFRVNTQWFMDQQQPTITGLADGGFVVAWQTTDTSADGSGWAVKAQRFSAAGVAVGAEFRVNSVAFGSQNNIDIASLANGGFVVTWQTGNSLGTQVYAQAYNADGTAAGTQLLVTDDFGSRTHGRVAGLPNGGFVVTWMTEDAEGLGVYAQLFDSSRNKSGAAFQVNTLSAGNQHEPDIAVLADGTFMITWQSSMGGIKGQTFSASGQRIGGEVLVVDDSGTETQASVAALAGGRFVVAFTYNGGTTSGDDIKLQMLKPNAAPDFGAETRSYSLTENLGTTVGTVTATDPDGPSPLSYSIVGGVDSARFSIAASTGVLSFRSSPDYENPTDSNGDNVYTLVVRVTDGDLEDFQTISVTVLNQGDAPVITSNGGGASAAIAIRENIALATTVTATDQDSAQLAYSISGGVDAARFAINAATGALTFVSTPDFEAPGDSNGDNVYLVTVRVSDGGWADFQNLTITVTNANDAPVIVSNGGGASAAVDLDEGQTAVTVVSATDVDAPNGLTYSITGGADAGRFVINRLTGALTFAEAPDFEAPADADRDNVYNVVVRASDGELGGSQSLQVTVRGVNEAVAITSGGAVSVAENGTAVTTVTASDLDGDAVAFAIAGGADASLFAIDSASGALSFVGAPSFEAPADSDGDNVYQVQVSATDGTLSDSRSISVTVTDEEEAIAFVSGGGGDVASVTIDENSGNVLALEAADPDGTTPFYGIAGGADAASFRLDPVTHMLQFASLPDFEAPGDSDGDNVYEVVVGTSDDQSSDFQTVRVTVGNVYEGIRFEPSFQAFSVDENETAVATVSASGEAGASFHYYLSGGADSSRFAIDAAGVLSFVGAPDFEAAGDSDGDNVYSFVISATDGIATARRSVTVTVGNVDEPVEIVSYGGAAAVALTMAENIFEVALVEARDDNGGPVTFAISGADADAFEIDPYSGALSFLYPNAPDFEDPASVDSDNVYDVVVTASSSTSSASQAFSVTIVNANDAPWIAWYPDGSTSVNEGETVVTTVVARDVDGDVPTYSIVGGPDAALFEIDAVTGLLTFIDAPDFETPLSAAGTNVYTVRIGASDGLDMSWENFHVAINDRNEGVTITSGGGGGTVAVALAENGTAVTSIAASDGDGDAVTYSIAGGADASLFAIDAQTGALSFVRAANFEAPADAGGDNVYDVTVSATDGTFTDSQSIAVTVGNVDEPVEMLSYGGAAAVALTMVENSAAAALVQARDEEGWPITYAITGGADAGTFQIDHYTGELSFLHPNVPDFEDPVDSDGDNIYELVVTAVSSTSSADQAFSITVINQNEGVWIYSSPDPTRNEGDHYVTTVVAIDREGTPPVYSIVGGADAALFAIDRVTGVLTFVDAPDYEAPRNAEGFNSYSVEVAASDGEFTDRQMMRITVQNVNEGVTIVSDPAFTVNENGLAALEIVANDIDDDPLTYSIAGGADASRFTIDARNGVLRFLDAPNYEAPADSDGNNVYDVVVSVTDGTFTDSQAVAVTVANLAEIVTITSNGGGANASVAVAENGTAVTTFAASNPDGGGAVTWAIAGGADAARFTINAGTGALAFLAAPNFEAPADSGANNVYDVVVSASNGATVDTQALAVTIGNVNEQMAITSNGGGASAAVSVNENSTLVTTVVGTDPDGAAVTYVILHGGDSGFFTIDSTTGALSFRAAPNFEAPADSDRNNVYTLVVMASDGHWADDQTITVTVGNVNEAPVITSSGGAASGNVSVVENGLAVTVVAATDQEGVSATYSIMGGADAARFTIDARTGALQFVAAPDWELPSDANQDNVYSVVVRASDGQLFDDQALNVSVANARDGNNVTGTSGGDSISPSSLNLALRTSNEEDTVFGRDGHDNIQGVAGDDDLYGEGGNDTLVGGAGLDRLTGGLGKDQFTYNSVSDSTGGLRDLILDFSRAQGDKISLSAIDANTNLSSNQAFTFIGSAAFTKVAGQLRYETSGGITTISGDVNGDGVADLQIQLSGSIALISSDFVL
ncbi:MAG TPA: cadherin domain-containing protein [Allosphingosinicella sp.]|nr:cadherin domain-containing protein [Allosphingosinicella sp.]